MTAETAIPAPTTRAVIARIRAFATAQGWRPARFAREAGLHPNTLREFDSESWSPSVATLQALETLIPADFTPARRAGVDEAAA